MTAACNWHTWALPSGPSDAFSETVNSPPPSQAPSALPHATGSPDPSCQPAESWTVATPDRCRLRPLMQFWWLLCYWLGCRLMLDLILLLSV